MNSTEFNPIVHAQIERCKNVLGLKAEEYATDDDRLHNFKQAAALQGVSPREALAGFMAKHTVSIYDMIQSAEAYTLELWEEKITDHINYLLLLDAALKDEWLARTTLNSLAKDEPVKIPDTAESLAKPIPTPAQLAQRGQNA